MRIGIDVCLLSKQRTGLGNYLWGLLALLPQIAPQHEYFLYSNRPVGQLFPKDAPVRYRTGSTLRCLPGSLWTVTCSARLAGKDNLDVYWTPVAILPVGLPPKVRKVITVHDLVWLRYPKTTTYYNLLVQKACARRSIASADSIVVVSQSTRDELVRTLSVPRQKTHIVYPGVFSMYKAQDSRKASEYISAKYGVPSHYLAALSAVEPRKNFRLLVETLRILKNAGQLQCPLLIAGPMGWKSSDLLRDIRDAQLTADDIRFLGYLPPEDVPLFYGGAQVFLFPSWYEGFGAPPVEAMACGAPVIASSAQCMPEILADAAILESPANAKAYAAAIISVLSDANLRQSMRAAGYLRANQFRYEKSVKHLLHVFEQSSHCTIEEPRAQDMPEMISADALVGDVSAQQPPCL